VTDVHVERTRTVIAEQHLFTSTDRSAAPLSQQVVQLFASMPADRVAFNSTIEFQSLIGNLTQLVLTLAIQATDPMVSRGIINLGIVLLQRDAASQLLAYASLAQQKPQIDQDTFVQMCQLKYRIEDLQTLIETIATEKVLQLRRVHLDSLSYNTADALFWSAANAYLVATVPRTFVIPTRLVAALTTLLENLETVSQGICSGASSDVSSLFAQSSSVLTGVWLGLFGMQLVIAAVGVFLYFSISRPQRQQEQKSLQKQVQLCEAHRSASRALQTATECRTELRHAEAEMKNLQLNKQQLKASVVSSDVFLTNSRCVCDAVCFVSLMM
jgi:hypothetical protein